MFVILLFILLQEKYNTRPKKFHLWWILKSHSWILKWEKSTVYIYIQYSSPFSRTDDTWFGGKIYPRCSGDSTVSLLIIYAKWQQFLKFVKYPCPRDCTDCQIPHSREILSRQIPPPCPDSPPRRPNIDRCIINRIIHGCLEIPYLFLVLNMISHSFAALTREISCSTLEINMVFPRTHVLFSI
jgi:hypothetical protein